LWQCNQRLYYGYDYDEFVYEKAFLMFIVMLMFWHIDIIAEKYFIGSSGGRPAIGGSSYFRLLAK
jgi:hypothetical protein